MMLTELQAVCSEASQHEDSDLQTVLAAIPELTRLQEAMRAEGADFVIVGGALRDILRPGREAAVKDIDCHVLMTSDELEAFAKTYYPDEFRSTGFAVTVGRPGTIDAIDLIPFNARLYDRDYVESDVNSLAYHLESQTLVDPFGTGYEHAKEGSFRIVAESMEAWYAAPFPGRANNGKAPRLLKMLAKGFAFSDPEQERAYVDCVLENFGDLAAKTTAGLFSTWAMVLGSCVRGDRLTFRQVEGGPKPGSICACDDWRKREKYEACLRAAESLDSRLSIIRKYMDLATARCCCPEEEESARLKLEANASSSPDEDSIVSVCSEACRHKDSGLQTLLTAMPELLQIQER